MMFPPLMGSLGRLGLGLAGQGIFRITLKKKLHLNTPEGASVFGAATFIVFGGRGESAPPL
jgi:hypothetical protein